jgi:hypothetical protein
VGKVAGFWPHAGVAARADQRKKLERLCRYISRPAVSEKLPSLSPNRNVLYRLKTPYRERFTRHLRGAGFHRPTGGLGAQSSRQRHLLTRGICAEQPVRRATPRTCDPPSDL